MKMGNTQNSLKKKKYQHVSPVPQPTSTWPEENITLLARYWRWLEEENSTESCIKHIYIPMAGHVLGLNLKPHTQLDISMDPGFNLPKNSVPALGPDLGKAMAYIQAKGMSNSWTNICRQALHRFRRFLQYERGQLPVPFADDMVFLARYQAVLPDWFIKQLTQMQHLRQVNWRPSRLRDATRRFWAAHTRLWRWLFALDVTMKPRDVKRQHLFTYIDEQLASGYAANCVNQDLRAFLATLRFLQERDFHIPLSLLRLPLLKEPDSLPRFLTDEQVKCLQTDFEQRLVEANKPAEQYYALLDRAIFYVMWHAGLRLGEVEDLSLADLNLPQRQIIVRQGKGMKDRTVYLTDVAVAALMAYLKVRGEGQTDHVFLFRHRPLCRSFVQSRLKLAAKRTGVKVTAHRLRHTCATQLVNAGCHITTIKAILGHRRLNSTMIYARVHNRTVAADYYAAMSVIEKRLEPHLHGLPETGSSQKQQTQAFSNGTGHLLSLVDAMNNGSLSDDQQQVLTQLRSSILALG